MVIVINSAGRRHIMDFRQLEYFVLTVKCGSFAAAARELYISSPAILRGVNGLEKELHIKLLERSGRCVKPTEFGTIFYDRALDVLEGTEELAHLGKAFLEKSSAGYQPTVTVALAPYRGPYVPPNVIAGLDDLSSRGIAAPLYRSNAECLTALREGATDSAIVVGRINDQEISHHKVLSVHPLLAVSKDHPLARRSCVSSKDLIPYKIARPYDLTTVFPAVRRFFESAGAYPSYQEVPPNNEAHLAFLHIEEGGVFVTQYAATCSNLTDAVFLPLAEPSFELPIYFAYTDGESARYSSMLGQRVSMMIRSSKFAS